MLGRLMHRIVSIHFAKKKTLFPIGHGWPVCVFAGCDRRQRRHTLVRGSTELKNTGPNHLPYWEVLIQYFHPGKQLKWSQPAKPGQSEIEVDHRDSKRRYSADRRELFRSVCRPSGRRGLVSSPLTVPKRDPHGGSPISTGTCSRSLPTSNTTAAVFNSPC